MSFSPNGKYLSVGSEKGIKFYDWPKKKELKSVKGKSYGEDSRTVLNCNTAFSRDS